MRSLKTAMRRHDTVLECCRLHDGRVHLPGRRGISRTKNHHHQQTSKVEAANTTLECCKEEKRSLETTLRRCWALFEGWNTIGVPWVSIGSVLTSHTTTTLSGNCYNISSWSSLTLETKDRNCETLVKSRGIICKLWDKSQCIRWDNLWQLWINTLVSLGTN